MAKESLTWVSTAAEQHLIPLPSRYGPHSIIKTNKTSRHGCWDLSPEVHESMQGKAVSIKLIGRGAQPHGWPSPTIDPIGLDNGHDSSRCMLVAESCQTHKSLPDTEEVDERLQGHPAHDIGGFRQPTAENPYSTLASPSSLRTDSPCPPITLQRKWTQARPRPRYSFITVYNHYQSLATLRDMHTGQWIYRQWVDGKRPLVFYWLKSRLVGIHDRETAAWLFEDGKFLNDSRFGSASPLDVERTIQNVTISVNMEEHAAIPVMPGHHATLLKA